MNVPVQVTQLQPDERKLIEIIRQIKTGVGFGEFRGTVANREITTVKEGYTHVLNLRK